MLKQFLNKSKQLELEDKIDEFLESRNLPHPRIEPDLVNIHKDRDKYISIMKTLFLQQEMVFKDEYIGIQKLKSWVQIILIDGIPISLDSIFYNNNEIINKTKEQAEYIYSHELAHLKQFTSSEDLTRLKVGKLSRGSTKQLNSIIEGFAEYIAYKTNNEWFKKTRKEDLEILKNYLNPTYQKEKKLIKKIPAISGFLIFNTLDEMEQYQKIKKLMINPLNENVSLNNSEQIMKAIQQNNLFEISEKEFNKPWEYRNKLKGK